MDIVTAFASLLSRRATRGYAALLETPFEEQVRQQRLIRDWEEMHEKRRTAALVTNAKLKIRRAALALAAAHHDATHRASNET